MAQKILSVFIFILFLHSFQTSHSLLFAQHHDTPTPFPAAEPESVGISSDSLKVIRDQISKWIIDEEIVGAEILIIKNRKTILHTTFGWRNREEQLSMEKNTICRIRSMTKPFIATSVLKLTEQGKLLLTDKMSKYLSSFDNEQSHDITIDQLLTQTSGFEDPGYPGNLYDYSNLGELVDAFGNAGPAFEPSTKYQYSNGGSSALAYLVSIVSGMPVEEFIQTQIIDQLGLMDTFCNLTQDDPRRSRVSCTYRREDDRFVKYWDNAWPQKISFFRGSGGMYSTTTDYARFLAMWMDRGLAENKRILFDTSIKLALTPTALNPTYARHWKLFSAPTDDVLPEFGHAGSDGTLAAAIPQKDLMILYFTQSGNEKNLRQFGALIRKIIY